MPNTTLTLPVAMKFSKDGEPIFVYRTFTEKDFDIVIAPFKRAFLADMEKKEEVNTHQ